MTTARPLTAPTLIAPTDNNDDALASAMKMFEGVRHARAASAHEWPARFSPTRIARPPFPQRARKGART
eukprot:7979987-Pyramimonas_sp.AAC.1